MALDPGAKVDPKEKRILVIDDDDNIREMLKLSFENEGFQVQVARDGRKVIEAAARFRADLIISDIMMPGGGGYEVLRSLQSDPMTRQTPLILITGYSFDDSTKKMMSDEPNVAALIEKPIRAVSLIIKVHEILKTKTQEDKLLERHTKDLEGFDPNSPFGKM